MAYFTVDGAFWTDADVMDNFTPEDKYFYLYLLTTPRSNISGCYELSINQAAIDLGYSKDAVALILKRFITQHKVVDYDYDTKEILITKWHKYHWTHSDKYVVALWRKVNEIKCEHFRNYLTKVLREFEDSDDRVSIPYAYRGDTTVTVTVIDNISNISGNLKDNVESIENIESKELEGKRDNRDRGVGKEEKEREETEALEKEPPVLTLPLVDRTEFEVTQDYINQLEKTYPAVDILQAFREMRLWCWDNPKRLKTKRGIKAFITTWLSKEQDKGGKYRYNGNYGGQKKSLTFYDVGMRMMEAESGKNGSSENANGDSGGISSVLF
jgi:hypothetical protein